MTTRKIAYLTDTCADLLPEYIEGKPVFTVPLRILCSDGEHYDGVDITPQRVYELLKSGELPKTSLPTFEDMSAAFDRIAEAGYDSVIGIMMSGALSGTANLARLAAEDHADRLDCRIFDSLSGSLGQAMILLQTMKELEAGADWDTMVNTRIPGLIAHTYPYFAVTTLEYLRKGGRIGKVTAAAGTLLSIKPVLGFTEAGELTSAAKVRGTRQLPEKLVELAVRAAGSSTRYNLAVANGGDPGGMVRVRSLLTEALPLRDSLWWGEIDSTLSVYIGDGILGAAVQVLDF